MKFVLKIALLLPLFAIISCGGSEESVENVDKGIGPIKSVTVGTIDAGLVATGSKVFAAKCTACHKIEQRYVGPALKGVTKKRSPEWIMNMIMNPEQMIKENEAAKALFGEFMTPMANQNIKEDEARALLEFLRSNE